MQPVNTADNSGKGSGIWGGTLPFGKKNVPPPHVSDNLQKGHPTSGATLEPTKNTTQVPHTSPAPPSCGSPSLFLCPVWLGFFLAVIGCCSSRPEAIVLDEFLPIRRRELCAHLMRSTEEGIQSSCLLKSLCVLFVHQHYLVALFSPGCIFLLQPKVEDGSKSMVLKYGHQKPPTHNG